MLYYQQSINQIKNKFKTSSKGLDTAQANQNLKIYGPNRTKIKTEPLWYKLITPFIDIFTLVLIGALVISVASGEVLDAVIIGAIIFINSLIYYVQRFSTERVLRALKKHVQDTTTVCRDHKNIDIDTTKIVPGDLVLLNEGEKIPADARILNSTSLRVDESQITGEALPISKAAVSIQTEKEIYEQTNMLFQGSFVISGKAEAIVVATGNDTEVGKLAVLSSDKQTKGPIQIKIDKLVNRLVLAIGFISILAIVLSLWQGSSLSESLRFTIALAVSAVPEGLVIAISVILVLGMRRMAKKQILVRSMKAIETIGAVTTILSDKTGTLTENKLSIQDVWNLSLFHPGFNKILEGSINMDQNSIHDPLDKAIVEYLNLTKPRQTNPLETMPFDHDYAMSGNVWQNKNVYEIVIKGAPEQIIEVCDVSEKDKIKIDQKTNSMASQGYRVIALAALRSSEKINSFADLKTRKMKFIGLIAIADTLRKEAPAAIQAAIKSGVTVRMITGDHVETAFQIGKQLNMIQEKSQVFDCRKLKELTDNQVKNIIDNIRVFARVLPADKRRLVDILNKNNITAMTGDGVNDVPALVGAHVGLAMGSGTDIAKEAGDIILLNDNFKAIVDAMQEGRVIISNIRRMVGYLLSTNIGEVIVSIGALLIGMPIPLLPVQILWCNLITDSFMVFALGLEPKEKNVLLRKPRKPTAPLLGKYMIARVFLISSTIGLLTLGVYAYYLQFGLEYARSVAFFVLVVTQWSSAINYRSDYTSTLVRMKTISKPFMISLSFGIIIQAIIMFSPLHSFLHFVPMIAKDVLIVGAAAFFVPIVVVEIQKWWYRKLIRNKKIFSND